MGGRGRYWMRKGGGGNMRCRKDGDMRCRRMGGDMRCRKEGDMRCRRMGGTCVVGKMVT